MKYTLQTWKYILKNFFFIFPLAVIPAFFLSLTLAREDFAIVLEKLLAGNATELTFQEIFQVVSILNFSSIEAVLFGFVGVVALVVFSAILMALLDKHMRIGKRTFNGMLARLNENLMPTILVVVLLLVLYEVWTVLLTLLLQLTALLPSPFSYASAGFVFLMMHILLLSLIACIYLWMPCMQITGFKAFEALRYSYILVEPLRGKIVLSQIFSMFFAELLISASVLLLPRMEIVSIVVATVLYAFMIMQFCVRMQVVYFDREQIERQDLKPSYYK
jgi:hypothetical protein